MMQSVFMLVRDDCTMVDYGAPTPPYRQVAEILRQRIADGTYQRGARLPSTRALVQEFGVAQFTAQKALRLLVEEGLAVMTHGMGTFVKADAEE